MSHPLQFFFSLILLSLPDKLAYNSQFFSKRILRIVAFLCFPFLRHFLPTISSPFIFYIYVYLYCIHHTRRHIESRTKETRTRQPFSWGSKAQTQTSCSCTAAHCWPLLVTYRNRRSCALILRIMAAERAKLLRIYFRLYVKHIVSIIFFF